MFKKRSWAMSAHLIQIILPFLWDPASQSGRVTSPRIVLEMIVCAKLQQLGRVWRDSVADWLQSYHYFDGVFSMQNLPGRSFALLENCSNLLSLRLSGREYVPVHEYGKLPQVSHFLFCQVLKKLTKLESLRIVCQHNLNDSCLAHLSDSIKRLEIKGCKRFRYGPFFELACSRDNSIARFPQLECLHFENEGNACYAVRDVDIDCLSSLTKLKSVKIIDCQWIKFQEDNAPPFSFNKARIELRGTILTPKVAERFKLGKCFYLRPENFLVGVEYGN